MKNLTHKFSFWNSAARWYALVIAWGAAWLLSAVGLFRFAESIGEPWTWMDVLYRTLQLIVLESGSIEGHLDPSLEVARFLLPALTGVTALQAVSTFFNRQISAMRLRTFRDHIVVIGLNKKCLRLLADARGLGMKCVVIANKTSEAELNTSVAALDTLGAELVIGDPREPVTQTKAGVQRAAYVVCMLGDDADNLRAAMAIHPLPNKPMPKRVVELRSSDLVDLIRGLTFGAAEDANSQLESYNEYRLAAQNLIDLDPDWLGSHAPQTIEIFGNDDLGARLAEKILYTWRANPTGGHKRLTLVGSDSEHVVTELFESHPEISDYCLLRAVTADLVAHHGIDQAMRAYNEQPEKVYICVNDPVLALRLNLSFCANVKYANAAIMIRAEEQDAELARSIGAGVNKRMANRISTFDPSSSWLTVDVVLGGVSEALARGLYYAYRKQTKAVSDRSAWDRLPDAEKTANRNLAARTLTNIRRFGYTALPMRDWDAMNDRFTDSEIEAMATEEHAAWRAEKIAAGWRVGERTIPNRKIHADLVDWGSLPLEERAKNARFFTELPRLLADLGYALEKAA